VEDRQIPEWQRQMVKALELLHENHVDLATVVAIVVFGIWFVQRWL
jgi:hypothetical protein